MIIIKKIIIIMVMTIMIRMMIMIVIIIIISLQIMQLLQLSSQNPAVRELSSEISVFFDVMQLL